MPSLSELLENSEFVNDYIYNNPEVFYLSRLDIKNLPAKLIFSICMDLHHNILDKCENTECNCIRIPDEDIENLKKINASLILLNVDKFATFLNHHAIYLSENYKKTSIKGVKHDGKDNSFYPLNVSEMLLEVMKCKLRKDLNLELELIGRQIFKLKFGNQILDDFETLLIKEFCRLRLNTEHLTYEEAYHIIEEELDDDFILELQEMGFDYPIYGFQDMNIFPAEIIQSYADSHSKEVPVTIKHVENTIKELKCTFQKWKSPKGARVKNRTFQRYVFNLTLLFNYDKFMTDKTADSIINFKISNQCFKLIYNFLDFWKLIDYDSIVKDDMHKYSFIKSTYKRYICKNQDDIMSIVSIIDKIKRVKMGVDNFTDDDKFVIYDEDKNMDHLNFINKKYFGFTENDNGGVRNKTIESDELDKLSTPEMNKVLIDQDAINKRVQIEAPIDFLRKVIKK